MRGQPYNFEAYRQPSNEAILEEGDKRGAAWEYDEWLREFEDLQFKYSENKGLAQIAGIFNPVAGIALSTVNTHMHQNKLDALEFDISEYDHIDPTEYIDAKNQALWELEDAIHADMWGSWIEAYRMHGSPFKTMDADEKILTEGWNWGLPKGKG